MTKVVKRSTRIGRLEKSLLLAMSGGLIMGGVNQGVLAQDSFNLGSTQNTVNSTNQNPVVINIGGVRHNVAPGSLVTPAELVAINQVLASGKQTILLGAQGNAVGGRVNVGSELGSSLANLAVPHNVTALANFSTQSNFNLSGDLTNAGKFYAFTNNPAVATATINAANIFNLPGGLISSVIPNSLLSLTGSVHPMSLLLNTSGVINNAGVISSSAGLSMNAAGGIVNALPVGFSGVAPSMVAATNVSMLASSIVNSGIINAIAGNINIASAVPSNIQIANSQGVLSALNGIINVRDSSYAGKNALSITGGDLLSKSINIFEGCGAANIHVNNLTGMINIEAGEAHVAASTNTLQLGTMKISGDPTFFNLAGDINLNGDISTSGNALAIVASGNITSSNAALLIDTTKAGADAGSLLIVAGANLAVSPVQNAGQINDDKTSTVSINGPSASGGNIDMSATNLTVVTSADASSKQGSVTMIAFAGANHTTGRINLPSSSIDAGGGITANEGVTMLGAADNGTGVNVNHVIANGPITIKTESPVLNGAITDGVFTGNLQTGQLRNSSVSVGDLSTVGPAAPILVYAGRDVNLAGTKLTTEEGSIGIFAGRDINSSTVQQVSSSGTADGSTSGAITMASGVNGVTPFTPGAFDSMEFSGPSLSGGSINLPTLTTLSSGNSSNNGSASQILLVAAQGLAPGSGKILMGAAKVDSVDKFTGNNIFVYAGSNTAKADALFIGSIDALTSTVTVHNQQLSSSIDYSTATAPNLPDFNINGKGDIKLGTVSGVAIDIQTGGNLTVGKITSLANTATLNVGGTASISDIDVSSASGFGGQISINAASISTAGNAVLNASGDNGGGLIEIKTTDNASTLNIGTGFNQFKLNVSDTNPLGIASGQIKIQAAGNLTVDASAVSANASGGNGAVIEFTAGSKGAGNLLVFGALEAKAPAAGGSISLVSNSSTPFSIGALAFTNGVSSVNSMGATAAGSIYIDAQGTGGISLDNASNLAISNDIVGGGTLSIKTAGTLIASSSQVLNAKGDANTLQVIAANFNVISSVELDASVNQANMTGGNIFIQSTSTKAGEGVISVGATGFTVDTSSSDANGLDAGNVTITSSSNINFNGNFMSITGGLNNGGTGTLTLKAGKNPTGLGTVIVNSNLNLNSVNSHGGSLFIEEGSKNPFLIGSLTVPLNGITGQVDVSGGTDAGTVSVTNHNGGITVVQSLVLGAANGSGAHVVMEAGAGDITFPSGIDVNGSQKQAGSVSLTARNGNILVPGNIGAHGLNPGVNGGSVTLISNSALTLVVNGVVGKNGVASSVDLSGSAGGTLYIENLGKGGINIGSISLTAADGNGATVVVKATGGGNVLYGSTLDVKAGGLVGANGGSVDLRAPLGNVLVSGFIDASSVSGHGGGISILSNSSKALFIDGSATVNGVMGYLSVSGANAGNISLTNLGQGITVLNTLKLDYAATGGSGASLYFNSGKGNLYVGGTINTSSSDLSHAAGKIRIVTNSATPFIIGNSSFTSLTAPNSVGDLLSNVGGQGSIQVTNSGSGGVTLTSTTNVQAFASIGSKNSGGTIIINSPAGVMKVDGQATINAVGESIGGTIRLNAQSYTLTGSLGPVILDAHGVLNGGVISIYSFAASKSLTIGLAPNQFSVKTSSTGASSGSITVSSGGNLLVNATGLSYSGSVSDSDGAYLSFSAGTAGTGTLLINGALDVSGKGQGSGGNISLVSNSSTPFFIGSAAVITNGVTGSLSLGGVNGGALGIKNSGDINIQDGSKISANGTGSLVPAISGIGGSLDFESSKGKFITNSSISSDGPLSGGGTGGTIIISATKYNAVSGAYLSAGGQNGGRISINQTDPSTLLLVGATSLANQVDYHLGLSGGVVTLSAIKGIVFNAVPSSTPQLLTLNLPSTGTATITTTGAGLVKADTLTINIGNGDIGSVTTSKPATIVPLQTEVANLSIRSGGNIYLNNSNLAMVVNNINHTASTAKNIQISSSKDIDVEGTILAPKATLSLTGNTNASIIVNGAIFAPIINLNANLASPTAVISGSGSIGQANSVLTLAAGGGIGTIGQDVVTLSTDLTINGKGSVYVANMGTLKSLKVGGSITDLSVSASGSINTASTITVSGALNLRTFASDGSVLITQSVSASSIAIVSSSSGSIYTGTSALLSAGTSIDLSSAYGNIGTLSTPVKVSLGSGAMTFNTGGAGSVNVSYESANAASLGSSSSGGDFILSSKGSLSIDGNLSANIGGVKVTTAKAIDIGKTANVHVYAGAGDLTLQVTDKTSSLTLGQSSSIIANGKVTLLVGAFTSLPPVGVSQANLNITENGSNHVYFNSSDLTVNAPVNNLNALGSDVVIVAESANGNVVLNGGATITANSSVPTLSSLDLKNAAVSAFISSAISNPNSGISSPNLKLSGGLIVSGDIFINNLVNMTHLTGLNIPVGVKVHFTDYNAANPIGVQVSSKGANPNIAGSIVFEQGAQNIPSEGRIFVGSELAGTVLTTAKTSTINADTNLAIFVGGDSSYAGSISAPGVVALQGTAGNNFKTSATTGTLSGTINWGGNLSTGAIDAPGVAVLASTAGLYLTGGLIQTHNLNLTVSGSNNLMQKAGNINATTMLVQAGELGASFSTAKNAVLANNVFLSTGDSPSANLSINFSAPVNILGGDVGGTLKVFDDAKVAAGLPVVRTANGALTCGSCIFQTSHLTANADIITTGLNGTITISPPNAASGLVIDGDKAIHATAGLTVSSGKGLSIVGTFNTGGIIVFLVIPTGLSLMTDSGLLNINSTGDANLAAYFSAGQTVPTYFAGTIDPQQILTPGTVKMNSTGKLTFGSLDPSAAVNGASVISVGGNILATGATIDFTGAGNTFNALGGNLQILSKGNISSNDALINLGAVAQGTQSTNGTGGGIQLSAGPASSLTAAMASPPETRPLTPLGPNVTYLVPSGVVKINTVGTGIVDLGSVFAQFSTNGGAVVLDGNSKTLKLNWASFHTNAFSPIGFQSLINSQRQATDEEIVVDSDDGLDAEEELTALHP